MNNTTFQPAFRRSLPQMGPSPSLGTAPGVKRSLFGENYSCLSPDGMTANTGAGDAQVDSGHLPEDGCPSKTRPDAGNLALELLCNYCSKEGNFRCSRCKRTCYCSAACLKEDWNAHRHVCKPCNQESPTGNKTQEPGTSPTVSGPKTPESMMRAAVMGPVKRVYLHELPKNTFAKGAQLQASVAELRNPGKFFIHVQSAEMMEHLRNVTMALQKTYAGSLGTEYLPDYGELCAVKYSQDQNWYRGAVQSADGSYRTASIFYIDFGNQEVVTLDRIKPLSACVHPAPPCAVECRVAGVVSVTGSWTEESCISARRLLTGKSFTLTVVDVPDSNDVWAVDIMLPAIGKKLSAFLVEQGYAMEESSKSAELSERDIDSILSAALENFRRSLGGRNDSAGILPPEPLTQGLGDSFTAFVTHVQSPSELICQKVDNARVIQETQLKLREYCAQTVPSEDFRPAPGSLCCSQFTEDQQWYRAIVLGYSSETRVCVGYVDFGNSEEVDLSRLLPITPELAAMPMQAIPCDLADVKPVSGQWSAEAIQLLKKSVCNKFVRVEIVGERQSSALVVLTDECSDPPASVNELLLSSGLALPDDSAQRRAAGRALADSAASQQPPTGTGPAGDSAPPPAEKADRTEARSSNDASRAPAHGIGHVILPSAAIRSATPTSAPEWSCVELPCEGQVVELVISVIVNPGEFYCHRYNTKDLCELKELSVQVLEHCRSQSAPYMPAVGEPCCAVFPGDRSWYRALVLGVAPDKKSTVYFVDYGNTSEVEPAQVRAMPAHFLRLPFQAVRCWLEGVEPPQGSWGADAARHFQALSVGRQLQARVCSITDRGYGVELTSDGQSISAQLVAQGLAKACGQQEPAAAAREPPGGTFPVDWKTVELPRNKPFQPRVAAVVSPSLFFVMREDNKDMEKVPALMKDLAAHCSTVTKASPVDPPPGAACCAQLTGDKNWYRAVVLRIAGSTVEIVCADYGMVEKVPSSNIVPIAEQHLLLPFQIVRCALPGKELFPAEFSEAVLDMFSSQLRGAPQATIERFDGTSNLLVLAPTEVTAPQRAGKLSGTVPQSSAKENETPATAKPSPTSRDQAPGPQFNALTSTEEAGKMKPVLKEAKTGPLTVETKSKDPPKQDTQRAATDASQPSTDGKCCCSHLIQKIDQLEQVIVLLIDQLKTSLQK